MTYPIRTVLPTSTQLEQLGTKAKFWYYDDTQKILFKVGRPGTGENWAEKACCEIARLLGLPHAEYELATWRNEKGVISPSIVPESGRLILGNELLARIDTSYEPAQKYKTTQHTLNRVIAVLQHQIIKTPLGWECPAQVKNSIGVFIGYLLLDALICNQDRHHENWALINIPNIGLFLAPTFDHASSLGRNETDENRVKRLLTKDQGFSIKSYVERARSGFYENKSSTKTLSTMEAFYECLKANNEAGQYWLERLSNINNSQFSDILACVPEDFISAEAREFAGEMLKINRNRLLSLKGKQ